MGELPEAPQAEPLLREAGGEALRAGMLFSAALVALGGLVALVGITNQRADLEPVEKTNGSITSAIA